MDPFDLRIWPAFAQAGGDPAFPAMVDQIVIDSRRIDSSNSLFVALSGSRVDGHQFVAQAARSGARFAIVRRDWIPSEQIAGLTLLRVDDPIRILQELARIYRSLMKCHVIAVAGSYGKTMVKDLLEAVLGPYKKTVASPESFNSQIGVPLSLFRISKEHEVAIIEAGISEKEEMERLAVMIQPHSVIFTPIGSKHIATFGNKEVIINETFKLLRRKIPGGWVIAPKEICQKFAVNDPINFWNVADPKLPHANFMMASDNGILSYQIKFPTGEKFEGRVSKGFYYFPDLLNMTLKAAWLLGVPTDTIACVLKNYAVEPSRIEIWHSPSKVLFINDIYSSDPQSIEQAARRLEKLEKKKRKIGIFGGLRHSNLPLADIRKIAEVLRRLNLDRLYLYGNFQFQELRLPKTYLQQCPTYQAALDQYKIDMEPEDMVWIKGPQKEPFETLVQTFQDSLCTNVCTINLAAIQTNISLLRQHLPKEQRIMVMVKAAAYGTNEVRIANCLQECGVDILGVSYVDEGVLLRQQGITQSIFVINCAPYEVNKALKWDFELGCSDADLIESLAKVAESRKKKVKLHLHIDTGMSRFGCRPQDALELAKKIHSSSFLQLEGVMTHFACADDPKEDAFTLSQAKAFQDVIQKIEDYGIVIPWKHAANSSGAIRFKFPKFNMVRLGLSIYGLHASQTTKEMLNLRLAISLTSRIVGINICKAGETISYGRKYMISKEMQKIAVLPIGYFDGLHRSYSGKAYVMIRGQKCPMVGNICMDFMMVDVTDIPHVSVGDPVLIFGEDEYGYYLSPEEFAQRGNSIIHELITCLGMRIQRVFTYEENDHLENREVAVKIGVL